MPKQKMKREKKKVEFYSSEIFKLNYVMTTVVAE